MPIELTRFYAVGILSMAAASGATYHCMRRWGWKFHIRLFYVGIALASITLFVLPVLKAQALHQYVDIAHWMGLLWNIIHTGQPESLSHEFIIPGTLNYFSVHFVPLLYALAIPFAVFSSPLTLLVCNWVLMLSALIPLYKLAYHLQGNRRFALFVASILLWYPTFQYIILYEFEMVRFSIPILLWMLYWWETRQMPWYWVFVALAVLVREELGLTIAAFGFSQVFIRQHRTKGLITAAVGLLGFVVIYTIVMPAFRSAGGFEHVAAGIAPQFGTTPLEVIVGIMRHPFLFFTTILHPFKIANTGMLFVPLLGIPLLAPTALIGAVANIGLGLLSNSFAHSSYLLYYISPSIPFIFYAFLKAWPKLLRRVGLQREEALMGALLIGVVVGNIFFGPSPVSVQFWSRYWRPAPFRTQDFHWSSYRVTAHHRLVNEFTRRIPNEAIVSTQQFLAPRLYQKRGIMVFPQLEANQQKYQASYVLLDTTNNGLRSQSPAFIPTEQMKIVQEDSEQWEKVYGEDGYELYHRKIATKQ